MKREVALTFSLAALSLAMLSPNSIKAQNADNAQPSQTTQSSPSGQYEAINMVSAHVALRENIDAGKAKPGDTIHTSLSDKIRLKNGTELPAGTEIIGVVAADDMEVSGTSKLAMNFNQAKLKDGTVIPIKATIIGIYPPEFQDIEGHPVKPGDEVTGTWTGHPDAVDELDALPGVDLHSKIASNNSGVLVSKKKHDVKLKYGSEIALAVAVAPQAPAGE
jgi:hypothetical protein